MFCIKKSHELCTAHSVQSYMDETKMKRQVKDSLHVTGFDITQGS